MRHCWCFVFLFITSIEITRSEVTFDSLCSSETTAQGMSSTNGNDEFEIDLYDSKFLPDETVYLGIKQKRQNYGIHEFVIRAFDYEGNIVGQFDSSQTGNVAWKHHTCPNGATVLYVDRHDGRGYRDVPIVWKATGLPDNTDEITFKADVVSSRQLYRVTSKPLSRRLSSGNIPYASDQSINIDYCGESQGCLIVPQQCNNDAKCEYALSWQVVDNDTARFHIIGRAQGFVGVGFSSDSKRGDDQVVLCSKDAQGHVFIHNTFVSVQTPQYILRERPLYGLHDAEGYSNATHIICKFTRRLSPETEVLLDQDGRQRGSSDRNKLVDLKQPHYMYPVYNDQDLLASSVMRIPPQDIPIVNNKPINFERRIWPKSHPNAGSIFAKLHGILNIIAWVLLASAGVMIARYFETIWPHYERRVIVDGSGVVTKEEVRRKTPFSYYTILPPILLVVAILTWLAFLFILIELDFKWTHGTHHMWHSILGLIVLVCAFFAPIVSFFRPRPTTGFYCVWYWISWLIISLAHCLAIPVIFLGMDNRRLDLWTWCSWLLFGWCIFHTVVQLIFEIHACFSARKEYEIVDDGSSSVEKSANRRQRREQAPGASWKPALLGLYLLITLIVVIVLVIAIILFHG